MMGHIQIMARVSLGITHKEVNDFESLIKPAEFD